MKERRPSRSHETSRIARLAAAEELAIAALTFIAGDPDQLNRFLALSGMEPEAIREAAREPGFLVGVLDYVAGDEQLLLAFASHNEIDPETIERARLVLAGEPEGFD